MASWTLPALLAGLLACGCQLPLAKPLQQIDQAGAGRARETRHERLQRLGTALRDRTPAARDTAFHLSGRDGVGAWSWPTGRVEVSRDLVDLLDDAELSAALAHELAHLAEGTAGDAGLAPASADEARERRADRDGCRLLASRGLRPEAMTAMLRTIAAALPEQPSLGRRIDAAAVACRREAFPAARD